MPNADEIVGGLTTITNSWQPVAILWHVYFGALAASLLMGWRPPKRFVAALLLPPLVSVGVLAWIGGNPFNGSVFALLSVALLLLLASLDATRIEMPSRRWLVVGALLFAFGWVYPHFLDARSPFTYFYAAPLGLIPCPTLSMTIAVAILCRGLGSRTWSVALVAAGLFYGVFGSLYLGVGIDWILSAGALLLLLLSIQQPVRNDRAAA